eukprot:gi/632935061/ref/XP_007887618.1/ PREDICTED: uncharacterized protein C2orf72 homolog [Callorhinchus milii]
MEDREQRLPERPLPTAIRGQRGESRLPERPQRDPGQRGESRLPERPQPRSGHRDPGQRGESRLPERPQRDPEQRQRIQAKQQQQQQQQRPRQGEIRGHPPEQRGQTRGQELLGAPTQRPEGNRGAIRGRGEQPVAPPDREQPERTDREFEQLVQAIGGRERILLVGELCESRQLMFQFVKALFPRPEEADKEPEPRRLLSPCPRVTELVNGSREQRRLRARLLLFLFRQEFLCSRRNEPLIRELLRDVRQRCCSWEPLPGLVGVVHTESDTQGEDLSAAVRFIEHQLRTVFHRHPSDCVQALPFVADRVDSVRELKKSSCDVLRASSGITSDLSKRRRSCLSRFLCFLRNSARSREDRPPKSAWSATGPEGMSAEREGNMCSQPLTVGPSLNNSTVTQMDSEGLKEQDVETEV